MSPIKVSVLVCLTVLVLLSLAGSGSGLRGEIGPDHHLYPYSVKVLTLYVKPQLEDKLGNKINVDEVFKVEHEYDQVAREPITYYFDVAITHLACVSNWPKPSPTDCPPDPSKAPQVCHVVYTYYGYADRGQLVTGRTECKDKDDTTPPDVTAVPPAPGLVKFAAASSHHGPVKSGRLVPIFSPNPQLKELDPHSTEVVSVAHDIVGSKWLQLWHPSQRKLALISILEAQGRKLANAIEYHLAFYIQPTDCDLNYLNVPCQPDPTLVSI